MIYVNHVYHGIVISIHSRQFPCIRRSNCYRARDSVMPDVIRALRDARDLLLVANRHNSKALGDFGYSVDDSPQAKAKQRAKLAP
jgi:hypothetical protein